MQHQYANVHYFQGITNKKTYKSLSETRKCECPFRLRGRPLEDYEGWMLKLIYGADNHDLFESLVSHLYVG